MNERTNERLYLYFAGICTGRSFVNFARNVVSNHSPAQIILYRCTPKALLVYGSYPTDRGAVDRVHIFVLLKKLFLCVRVFISQKSMIYTGTWNPLSAYGSCKRRSRIAHTPTQRHAYGNGCTKVGNTILRFCPSTLIVSWSLPNRSINSKPRK